MRDVLDRSSIPSRVTKIGLAGDDEPSAAKPNSNTVPTSLVSSISRGRRGGIISGGHGVTKEGEPRRHHGITSHGRIISLGQVTVILSGGIGETIT